MLEWVKAFGAVGMGVNAFCMWEGYEFEGAEGRMLWDWIFFPKIYTSSSCEFGRIEITCFNPMSLGTGFQYTLPSCSSQWYSRIPISSSKKWENKTVCSKKNTIEKLLLSLQGKRKWLTHLAENPVDTWNDFAARRVSGFTWAEVWERLGKKCAVYIFVSFAAL